MLISTLLPLTAAYYYRFYNANKKEIYNQKLLPWANRWTRSTARCLTTNPYVNPEAIKKPFR